MLTPAVQRPRLSIIITIIIMDLTWRTAAWDATGKQTDPPAFLYHADRSAFAVQISQAPGNDRMNFVREKHCRVVQSEEEWDDYLEEVFKFL